MLANRKEICEKRYYYYTISTQCKFELDERNHFNKKAVGGNNLGLVVANSLTVLIIRFLVNFA